MSIEDIDLDDLDPGIRDTVARLRGWGFETCDSGDGQSKAADGWDDDEIINEPHVFIQVDPDKLRSEADRLYGLISPLIKLNIEERRYIDASYNPEDGVGLLSVFGILDEDWPIES